jgi:hypothetical protein
VAKHVYILWHLDPSDENVIMGVYSTKELAEAARDYLYADPDDIYGRDSLRIDAYRLDLDND